MILTRALVTAALLAGTLAPAFTQDGVFFCPDHPNQPHLSIHHGLAAHLMPTCQVSNRGLDATITVRSPTEILWNRFSVAKRGSLRIQSADGANWTTVHRVTNGSIASVDGVLSSTGNLALLAEGGIVVSETGMVDAPQFVASTLTNVDTSALLDGRDTTFGTTARFGTPITVDGSVTAPEGVTLLAEDILVKGSVLAPRGRVVMGAGGTITLRSPGTIQVDSIERKGSIVNAGVIEGSAIEMRVDGGRGPIVSAVTNTGTIRATGEVLIDSGPEPTAVITNVDSTSSVIQGRPVTILNGKLQGAPVTSFGPVDGSNPAGISATRQFVGTGAARATQIRPIQLSTVQRETSLPRTTTHTADKKKKRKAPIIVASSRSGAAAPVAKEKKKSFYRYQSFFETRRSE
ncbi:MAG: filamentous hemagglutinin N-terminal domain-containing protein [Verrucomicrobiae bacterium]|nr:filamentous hemagglutinin N-terminal domain-containing protein [Verrucomicrobiae bacterium]